MTKTPQTFKSFLGSESPSRKCTLCAVQAYLSRASHSPSYGIHFPEDCVLLVSMELDPCSACFYNGPDARLIICLLWKNTVQYYSDKERVSPDNERTFLWLPHPLNKSQHTSTAGTIGMHILVNVQYLQ